MGRHTYSTLAELESLFEQVKHTFSSSGINTPRRFYFYPPGDISRPLVEVVKVSGPTIDINHFGGKYIGYGQHEFVIESVEEFLHKILPHTEPVPELPSDGMISYDGLLVGLEV